MQQNRPDLVAAHTDQGISIEEKFSNIENTSKRPEMKGPTGKQSEINTLLSGLKTKQINVHAIWKSSSEKW